MQPTTQALSRPMQHPGSRARPRTPAHTWFQVSSILLSLAPADLLRAHPRLASGAALAFSLGILCFSGSLYLLSLTDVRWLGAIAPLGGAAFIAGWTCLALAAWRG